MKKILRSALILIVLVVCFSAAYIAGRARVFTVGHIPYRTCSTCSLMDTGITYNDNPNVLATIDFFTSVHYFDSNAKWFLGNGSRHMIDAEGDGVMLLGDAQDLANSTKAVFDDNTHTIALQASVVLPELPNCARLSTDSDGKIICGESVSRSVRRLSSEVAALRKKVSAHTNQ